MRLLQAPASCDRRWAVEQQCAPRRYRLPHTMYVALHNTRAFGPALRCRNVRFTLRARAPRSASSFDTQASASRNESIDPRIVPCGLRSSMTVTSTCLRDVASAIPCVRFCKALTTTCLAPESVLACSVKQHVALNALSDHAALRVGRWDCSRARVDVSDIVMIRIVRSCFLSEQFRARRTIQ